MLDAGWYITSRVKIKSGVIVGSEIDILTMKTTDKSRLVKRNIGIEYKNECTAIDFMIERKNYTIGDLKPETSLQLVIYLKGIVS